MTDLDRERRDRAMSAMRALGERLERMFRVVRDVLAKIARAFQEWACRFARARAKSVPELRRPDLRQPSRRQVLQQTWVPLRQGSLPSYTVARRRQNNR